MRTRMLGALSATLLVVAASGCGSDDDYANASRPPAPVSISISIVDGRIAVDPASVGAGPVTLLIANESSRSHDVTLSAPSGSGDTCVAADASSGLVNPQGAASIQLPLVEGTCEVGVADGTLEPARLRVGPERESAQRDLLQP